MRNPTASTPDATSRRFGRFELRSRERVLLADGVPVALGARAFDLLVALAERPGTLITKDDLLAMVWPGLVVEENNLQVQVSTLRKILGQSALATIPGRGYRFNLPVALADAAPRAPAIEDAGCRPTRPPERRDRRLAGTFLRGFRGSMGARMISPRSRRCCRNTRSSRSAVPAASGRPGSRKRWRSASRRNAQPTIRMASGGWSSAPSQMALSCRRRWRRPWPCGSPATVPPPRSCDRSSPRSAHCWCSTIASIWRTPWRRSSTPSLPARRA